MANITLQTIESLPLAEEVNENTSLVGWDGTQTVRVPKDMVGRSESPSSVPTLEFTGVDEINVSEWVPSISHEECVDIMRQNNGLMLGNINIVNNTNNSPSYTKYPILCVTCDGENTIRIFSIDNYCNSLKVYWLNDGTITNEDPGFSPV